MADASIANQARARARAVRQDGSYCGLFEITVWCSMKNVRVLLLFGTRIMNVYAFCGHGLPPIKANATHRLVAVLSSGGKLLSADKPDVSVPEANHFVIVRSAAGQIALDTSEHLTTPRYLPNGGRRKAADVALYLGWRLQLTVCQGDCLIDALAYWDNQPRDAVSWKIPLSPCRSH